MPGKMAVPHVASARSVQQAINAVIPDIKLFFNHRWGKWVVAQVKKNPGGLILPELGEMSSESRPYVLYKIETEDHQYREPSEWDVRYAIQLGKNGQEAIAKGGDWFMDQLERKEAEKREKGRQETRRIIADAAGDLRRAMRGDIQR